MEVFRIADSRRFSPERATRVSLFDRPRLVTEIVCLEPDQELQLRENSVSDELYFVVEGHAAVRVGMQAAELDAQEGILVPPGVKHSISNPGPGRLTVLVLVAPKPTRSAEVYAPALDRGRGRSFGRPPGRGDRDEK